MTKKTEKKQETKNDNKTVMIGEPWKKDEKWVRLEIVNPKLVLAMLERCGLPIDETEQERTDRLSSYFVHEERKKKIKLIRCVPNNEHDSFGCGFMSDEKLDACPFCGSGDEIVTLPKDPPKADVDIELNVRAAEKKAEAKSEDKKDEPAKTAAKKGEGGVAKVSSKDVRAKKKERGEVVEDKPVQPATVQAKEDAIAVAEPEVVAIDVPEAIPANFGKKLATIEDRIDVLMQRVDKVQAESGWEIGQLLVVVRDEKLWLSVRHEDGSHVYGNFNSYVAQRFDWTPEHAMLVMRISKSMPQHVAELIGVTKAKAIIGAKLPDDITEQLVAFASEKNAKGELVHGLRALWIKIKDLKNPQLPTPNASGSASVSSDEPSSPDERADEDDEDSDDEDDDDDAPDSTRPTATSKPAKPAQMTSVSFEKREFSIPLAIKGSQVKPAKKIQDEPHGTLSLPGGSKIHFVVRIGDDGQLFVDGKVETPY